MEKGNLIYKRNLRTRVPGSYKSEASVGVNQKLVPRSGYAKSQNYN